MEAIPERLSAARRLKKMTQRELGKLIGLSEQCVNKYEAGDVRPSIGAFVRICSALSCSADYLLGGTPPIGVPS